MSKTSISTNCNVVFEVTFNAYLCSRRTFLERYERHFRPCYIVEWDVDFDGVLDINVYKIRTEYACLTPMELQVKIKKITKFIEEMGGVAFVNKR